MIDDRGVPLHVRRAVVAAVSAGLALTSCSANPPPPEVVTEQKTDPAPAANAVVVAVDEIGSGFNPHLLSNQTPTIAAVAALVLPSPFLARPAVDRPGATEWVLNDALLSGVDVVTEPPTPAGEPVDPSLPMTISYHLQLDAQWSDGAPIAAEDFVYLWQQMISQPGVVDRAGYELITAIDSVRGGKSAVVKLRHGYPGWQQLFADLLPSHLIKDNPGGFATGMSSRIPFSGSYFHVKTVDLGRGEVLLERNDRYWGEPAKPDQILFRRRLSGAALAESLRTNDVQLALVGASAGVQAQLQAIPEVRTARITQSRGLQLVLNGRNDLFRDQRARVAVMNLLDANMLALSGTGLETGQAAPASLVRDPSDPAYAPSAPPRLPRDVALALLAEVNPAGQKRMRVGVPTSDDVAYSVARGIGDQLASAGIKVEVSRLDPDVLYGQALVDHQIDALVTWNRAGMDPATMVASRFGCDPVQAPLPASAPPKTHARSTTTPTTPTSGPSGSSPAPSNLSGVCDSEISATIEDALSGAGDPVALLAAIDPALWNLATVLPIAQDSDVAVAGPRLQGASLANPLPVGVVSDAHLWRVSSAK